MNYPLAHVIVQMTSFCNIDCKYCYLTDRSLKSRLTIGICEKIAKRVCEYSHHEKDVVWSWHAGEPLAVGLDHFRKCHDSANSIFDNNKYPIHYTVQTNGTLITDGFANFFAENKYIVSLSIDGPEFLHDLFRVDRSGNGTFYKTIRGLNLLRSVGIDSPVICVISAKSLYFGKEIVEFFGDIGVSSLAFNFEEIEGVNQSTTLIEVNYNGGASELRSQISRFAADVIECRDQKFPRMAIRELDSLLHFIKNDIKGQSLISEPMRYITVSSAGDVFFYSPELAGHRKSDGDSFSVGNVKDISLSQMLNAALLSEDYCKIKEGIEMCRAECDHFTLCGGGSPGNKFFENGRFNSTETAYCKIRFKYWVDAVISSILGSNGSARSLS